MCKCLNKNKPALEHDKDCPKRLSFFGAPAEWGVVNFGDVKTYNNNVFVYTELTWMLIQDMPAEFNRKERKEKIKKIESVK